MTIKTIATGLMTAAEAKWLLPAVATLARRWTAHLIAVHPVEPFVPYVGFEMGIADLTGPMFLDWQVQETAAIKAMFDAATGPEDFKSEWRSQAIEMIRSDEFLVDMMRPADLVVLGQCDPKAAPRDQRRLQEQVIRQSGRPVLLIPHGQTEVRLARHLLVGWSNTRESARATHDALALAEPGAVIDILFVGNANANMVLREDLAAALDRLGFKPNLINRAPAAHSVADALMAAALEQGADMIVSGAFGHSRAYDFVIGAVTSDLLDKVKVPLLLSK